MAVSLNPLDANLNLQFFNGNLVAKSLSQGALALLWGGVRGTLGVCGGKYYFRVKVEDNIPAQAPPPLQDADLGPLHLCRIGISALDTDVANLGDQLGTWMYSSTGVIADGPSFIGQERARPFGEPFFPGDEICCFVDAASRPGSVSFTKNGKWLGQAFSLPSAGEVPLFPHLLLRNVQCRVSFHGPPKQDYQPWKAAITQPGHFQMGPSPYSVPQHCEVIVTVGMPGCGKTTWCQEEIVQNPGKRYMILSTAGVLVQMKVPGLKEGHHRHGVTVSPTMKLLEKTALMANNLLHRLAPDVARNYIIDHTNIFDSPRTKKVEPFARAGFNVRAAVIIVPDPVLFERQGRSYQEEGKSVSDSKIAACRGSAALKFMVRTRPGIRFALRNVTH